MERLCIIPCGTKKIWDKRPDAGPAKAKDTYIGIFHNLCQEYASRFFNSWVILSAKHGFLEPEDVVEENYDVAFNSKSTEIISAAELKEQIRQKQLSDADEIVVLGGKKYKKVVEAAFGSQYTYRYPLSDCKGIGYMQQKLKTALVENKEMTI
ncbi:DUF6884 domain-containing protein [Bacillus thermotolerans]|uniref:DUF6884 domain-containing protein n=1 Tax=Bacillus thermotolerans TaxID=1221996 RepID=UPI00057ED777|nr:DUF6884 domain-containing protein [Bacillus thermotolerans]KKB33301.1 hypothetical protein QY97_03567 [Bacillus thermotolerans]KKB41096.1 hypothetical protein QY96_02116 [Bacillus thermotolerans]